MEIKLNMMDLDEVKNPRYYFYTKLYNSTLPSNMKFIEQYEHLISNLFGGFWGFTVYLFRIFSNSLVLYPNTLCTF